MIGTHYREDSTGRKFPVALFFLHHKCQMHLMWKSRGSSFSFFFFFLNRQEWQSQITARNLEDSFINYSVRGSCSCLLPSQSIRMMFKLRGGAMLRKGTMENLPLWSWSESHTEQQAPCLAMQSTRTHASHCGEGGELLEIWTMLSEALSRDTKMIEHESTGGWGKSLLASSHQVTLWFSPAPGHQAVCKMVDPNFLVPPHALCP